MQSSNWKFWRDLAIEDFKVICQNNRCGQVTQRNTSVYQRRPDHFIIRRLRRLRAEFREGFSREEGTVNQAPGSTRHPALGTR
jgi:hypothetical protein